MTLVPQDQPEEQAPPPDREQDQDWLFEQAEKRLAAANSAIGTTRTFFFALLSIAAYIGVVIAGTTDEQLLRVDPVKLPIINVEVPLTGFYIFVPWLFVLLHFNLLIHLGLTSTKLKGFLDDLKPLDESLAQRLRRDVANLPLAQWMVGQQDKLFRVVLSILVWILLIFIPPLLLLWMQLRFLPYQNGTWTWLQAAAVGVDAILIVGFRAWFVQQIQPETRWRTAWKERRKSGYGRLVDYVRLLFSEPLVRYLVPLIPLVLAGFLAVKLSDLLAASKVESCGDKPETGAGIIGYIQWWHCGQNRLDLPEELLTAGEPSPEHVNALRGTLVGVDTAASRDQTGDDDKQKTALDAILGLDLRKRHLRGANFYRSVLPKSDLRYSQLQRANLIDAQLQGANLRVAQLRSADLRGARLQGAHLEWAKLAGANLRGAQLQGAKLSEAQLESANLREANLEWADLTDADLSFADLRDTKNLETAELAGADYIFAELEGTFLDINQPPPDVLPAP